MDFRIAEYNLKSGMAIWILALMTSGRSPLFSKSCGHKANLTLSPTSHYWGPYSRIEDYGLKVSITSEVAVFEPAACEKYGGPHCSLPFHLSIRFLAKP
jgi:hypothetical protein